MKIIGYVQLWESANGEGTYTFDTQKEDAEGRLPVDGWKKVGPVEPVANVPNDKPSLVRLSISIARESEEWQRRALLAEKTLAGLFEPTEKQWGGLARDIVMWMQCYQHHTPGTLLTHLNKVGAEIPTWLHEEMSGRLLDRALEKGTIATIIYKAMLSEVLP